MIFVSTGCEWREEVSLNTQMADGISECQGLNNPGQVSSRFTKTSWHEVLIVKV